LRIALAGTWQVAFLGEASRALLDPEDLSGE
jgi:hypothetical protein